MYTSGYPRTDYLAAQSLGTRSWAAQSRDQTMMIQAILLPLIVIAIVIPLTLGFIFGGPVLGVFLGVLAGGVMVGYGVRQDSEALEVSEYVPGRTLLAVCTTELTPEAVADLDHYCPLEGEQVTVVAPLRMSKLDQWAGDLGAATTAADRRAGQAAQLIKAAGAAQVSTEIGDADLWLAVADALRRHPSRHLCLLHRPGEESQTIDKLLTRSPVDFRDLSVAAQSPTGSWAA